MGILFCGQREFSLEGREEEKSQGFIGFFFDLIPDIKHNRTAEISDFAFLRLGITVVRTRTRGHMIHFRGTPKSALMAVRKSNGDRSPLDYSMAMGLR